MPEQLGKCLKTFFCIFSSSYIYNTYIYKIYQVRTEVWQLFEFWVHPTESLTWGVFPCSCAILTMLSPMHVTRVRYLSRTYYISTLLLVTSPLTTSPGPLCDQSLWIFFLWSQQTPWNWQQSPECHISPCSGNIGQYFHLWANLTKKGDWGTEKSL